jgi:hypothetical protein
MVELYYYSTICLLGIELKYIVKCRDKFTFTCHLRSDTIGLGNITIEFGPQ